MKISPPLARVWCLAALLTVAGATAVAQVPPEWHFAWDTLADPSDLDFLRRQPLRPTARAWGDGHTAPQGHATYYARVYTGAASEGVLYGLALPDVYTSYRLYANGELVTTRGEVGTSAETQSGYVASALARLPAVDTVDLVLQLANYVHARGGRGFTPTIAPYDDLLDARLRRYFSNGLLTALYLLGAFVMWGSYRLFRDSKLPLWAAGVSVAMAYRSVGTTEHPLNVLLPALSYDLTTRLEYLSIYLLIACYVELIYRMTGRRMPWLFVASVRGLTGALATVTAVAPIVTVTGLLPPVQAVVLAGVVYLVAVLAQWGWRDWRANQYGVLSFMAMALWSTGAILDNRMVIAMPMWLASVLVLAQLSTLFLHVNRLSVRALQRLRHDAEEGSAAKSAFLATMSHEIRTPMNGVLGMTSLLSDTELTPEQRQYVDTIRISGQNLITIINDVLDFSKADAGKMSLELQPTDLSSVLESTAALVQGNARQKGLALDVDLPAEWRRVRVEADATRLSQVVTNLLSNAVKFTDAGHVRLAATGSLSETRLGLRITVEDSGIGMTPAQVGGLFTSFAQADSSITRRFGGTGLGLAISKQLVGLMGGVITVASAPGEGSRFEVSLSLKRLPDVAPAPAPGDGGAPRADLQGAPAAPPLPDLRILVAEDHPINQRLIATILRKWGYEPDLVGDGREAVAAIDRQAYDLIFMDMQMPVCDGLTATREIRRRHAAADVRIVALTANAQASDRAACLAAGMQAFIAKPFKVGEIRETLAEMAGAEAI